MTKREYEEGTYDKGYLYQRTAFNKLWKDYQKLKDALIRISEEDYRGYPPQSVHIARKALEE